MKRRSRNQRVQGTEEEQVMDAAYTAWRTDQTAGKASILVAETQQSVTSLNQRARADRIIDGTVNPDKNSRSMTGPPCVKATW